MAKSLTVEMPVDLIHNSAVVVAKIELCKKNISSNKMILAAN